MTSFNMSPKRILVVSALLTGLVVSSCATKPERRGPPPDDKRHGQQTRTSGTFLYPVSALFVTMDKNGDKLTSRSELTDGIASEWSGFEKNPSAVSFQKWSKQTLGSTDAMPNFMSFDKDFNGVVVETEFLDKLEDEFDRLDKNDNGRLERSEMVIAFAAPQGRRSNRGNEEGDSQRSRRGGQGGGRPPR